MAPIFFARSRYARYGLSSSPNKNATRATAAGDNDSLTLITSDEIRFRWKSTKPQKVLVSF